MNGDGNKAAIAQASFRSSSSSSRQELPPPQQQQQQLIRGSGGGAFGMFPFFTMYASKADQILSRYRPIAPKPPAPKPDGAAATTTTDSTTAAAQSSSSVTSRKGRKRSGEALASPRAYKRGASNRKQQAAGAAASAGVVPVVVEMAGNVVNGVGAMVPAMAVAAMEAASGRSLSTLTASMSVSPSGRSSSEAGEGLWKVMRPDAAAAAAVAAVGGGISSWCERFRGGGQQLKQQHHHHPLLEDAGSTAAVVVNAPGGGGAGFVRVGGDGVNAGCGWKSGYQMLQMDQNLSQQQQLLLQQHKSNNSRSMSDLGSVNSAFVYSNVQLSSAATMTTVAQAAYDSNNEACSNAAGDVDNRFSDDKPKLVTLSLLPDTPSHPQAHHRSVAVSESSSAVGSGGGSRFRLRFSDDDDDHLLEQQQPPLKLSLFSGGGQDFQEIKQSVDASIDQQQQQQLFRGSNAGAEQRVPEVKQQGIVVGSSALIRAAAPPPVIDVAYLEQAYGGSSDPVMLTDEGNRVLWANLAYTKVRMSGAGKPQRAATAVAGPYIDPLGLPTQLGCFTFRRATECSAVLWGFLKKFMFRENAAAAAARVSGGGGGEVVEQRVITPLPIRLVVGSTVCLDCITEANCYSGYLVGSLETVEAQLDKAPLPALVTDRSNRVRWVNAAFHQLVGRVSPASAASSRMLEVQDSNSNSTSASSAAVAAAAAAAALEVCFMFQTEKSPYSAVSLAGQVRVDWMDRGKRCCLASIPCEMRRLDDEHFGSLFVWKLNLNVVEAAAAATR